MSIKLFHSLTSREMPKCLAHEEEIKEEFKQVESHLDWVVLSEKQGQGVHAALHFHCLEPGSIPNREQILHASAVVPKTKGR